MKKILLSQKINPAGMALLEGKYEVVTAPDCSAETMLSMCGDVNAIILRTTSAVDRKVIEAAKALEIVSRTGAGVDNVDVQAATERKILVCNLPRANNLSVCEHAISLIMNCAKQIEFMQEGVRQGNWKARNAGTPVELEDKTLGVIGMGHIGSLVAKKCHDGLGMKILAYDPYVVEKFKDYDYRFCDDLATLFKEADFITLHCPNIPETKGMVTRELLFSMKPDAYIINTARGTVIDEKALIDLLTEKRIAGAGLDVFEKEPPDADNPLLHMQNVVVTPHSAALTREASIRMSFEAAKAVDDYFSGKTPEYIFNRKELGL
jgi:D-3-phosphoglycerate dehydrogenase